MTNLGSNQTLLDKEEKTKLLYKHVATIHKANTLSLLQNKISNVLYFNAYKELKTKEVHSISIGDLCKQLEYKGHNDFEIKKSLRGLIGTIIEWNLLKDETLENEHWTASTMLASARIKPGGVCEYSYSFHLRELLSDPVLYGVINMAYQANFRSKYGLALYENCARFVNVKQTGWLELRFFRQLMGVPDGSYLIFRDFKRRVLEVAVQEVNTYSNLYVEASFKKVGRRVSAIKFIISKRDKKKKIHLSVNKSESDESSSNQFEKPELLIELQRDFDLKISQAKLCLETYPEDYIREKMQYIKSSGKNIKSISAYLISALKNDYNKGRSFSEISTSNLENAKRELLVLKAEKFAASIETAFISREVRENFLGRFKDYLRVNENKLHKIYLKEGLGNSEVVLVCMLFCKEKYTSLYEEVIQGDMLDGGQ